MLRGKVLRVRGLIKVALQLGGKRERIEGVGVTKNDDDDKFKKASRSSL